jgi:alginate O-acetyltransferase complex protein AlgI
MVFSTISFIFIILPLFLLLDSLARKHCVNTAWRNMVMLTVSLLFYLWGEAANIFILLGLCIVNYIAGKIIAAVGKNKIWLGIFISIDLAVLIGFKYAAWLVTLVIPGVSFQSYAMPLGISFFTFHAISYLFDVYRGKILPAKSALSFLTYFCMFSHLVAGPIVRYSQVTDDLNSRGPSKDLFAFGMYRFFVGLNKKVIIANSVSIIADNAFSLSALGELSSGDAWLGIFAYTIQIYFDFSGYSDMAIGLAAMAGFHFEENFQRPYSSVTIKDFWRRWHISLSSWFRDYMYLPLGGNKRGNAVTYRNLLLVFFFCGLWHGADLSFIIWGLWHGGFLILERLKFGHWISRLPLPLGRVYVMLVVVVGWVFFRAKNMDASLAYLSTMFTPDFTSPILTYYSQAFCALIIGIGICLLPDKYLPAPTSKKPEGFSLKSYIPQMLLAVVSIAFLFASSRNPFIYFNF